MFKTFQLLPVHFTTWLFYNTLTSHVDDCNKPPHSYCLDYQSHKTLSLHCFFLQLFKFTLL